MAAETEVRFAYTNIGHSLEPLRPFFWKNASYVNFARRAGYNGAEFHPLYGAAKEVLNPRHWLKNIFAQYPHPTLLDEAIAMTQAADKTIPFVVEIPLESLHKAGVISLFDVYDPRLERAAQAHRDVIDTIRAPLAA